MENEGLTMTCSRAAQLLQLYIDRRLTMRKMRELEYHLSQCSACRCELHLLETMDVALRQLEPVAEPANLTEVIMQRVALSPRSSDARSRREVAYAWFHISLSELLSVVLLATIATLGVILGQPSLRSVLPFANGHDQLSRFFIGLWGSLMGGMSSSTLMLVFWICGTFLGIWITLILAGSEVRTQWLKAVMDRLPVL
jgi:anti-sigma factor RsiW